MKFIVALILTALLSFIGGLYFPWWSLAVCAFIVGLMVHQKAAKAFLASFAGAFLLWSGLAWWMDTANESILSTRIAELLGIGNNPFALVLLTGFIAGVLAGLAALSGHFLRSVKK